MEITVAEQDSQARAVRFGSAATDGLHDSAVAAAHDPSSAARDLAADGEGELLDAPGMAGGVRVARVDGADAVLRMHEFVTRRITHSYS